MARNFRCGTTQIIGRATRHTCTEQYARQLGGKLNGWDVADAFRKAHPQIPVIYTSGQIQSRKRQLPGSTFLPKPYLPCDIVELIDRRAA